MPLSWWSASRNRSGENGHACDAPPKHFQILAHLGNFSTNPPILIQFRPAWKEQAYLRFAGVPHRIENSSFYRNESTGQYPQFNDGHFSLPRTEILKHLATHRHNLDCNLNAKELAESKSYASIVEEILNPLLDAIRWGAQEKHVSETVVKPLRKVLPWPMSRVSPWLEERRSLQMCKARELRDLTFQQLLVRAREYCSYLDVHLSNQSNFFFGNTPSTLDAIVFGFIANAMVDFSLVTVLPDYPHLMRFFKYVVNQYFSETPLDSVSQQLPDEEKRIFSESIARANYVNNRNQFNQIQRCVICADVPVMRDPFVTRTVQNSPIVPYQEKLEEFSDANGRKLSGTRSILLWSAGMTTALFMYCATWLVSIEIENDEDP